MLRPSPNTVWVPFASLDQFDAVSVGIADEAEPRAAFAHRIGRLFRFDSLLFQSLECRIQVVHADGDVPVARSELVGVDAEVVRQLEPGAVFRQAHEHVDRLVSDWEPAHLLESEGFVEGHRAVDLTDPVAGVQELHWQDPAKQACRGQALLRLFCKARMTR